MEVREDGENFCSIVRTASLHCITTPFNESIALNLAFPSRFLYLSGTLSRDCTMNCDENEVQMDQPFPSGALRDRQLFSDAVEWETSWL